MPGMTMSTSPPSHTVSTFYHLLLVELAFVIVLLFIVGWSSWMWRRYGQSFMDEIGMTQKTTHARWAVDALESPVAVKLVGRTVLTIGLGIMWIIDGFLQAQPALGTQMLQNVIQPMLQGQPRFITTDFLETSSLMFQSRPLTFDSLTVWIQILIGVGILLGPTRVFGRFALRVSIIWSAVVWIFGEGLGQLFNGGTWLTGAPGAVLFYAFIAFLLLRPVSFWKKGHATTSIAFMFAFQWVVDVILQATPGSGFWGKGALRSIVLPMAQMPQPHVLSGPLNIFANALGYGDIGWNVLFVTIPLLMSTGWFISPNSRILLWMNVAVLALSWWLFQDFGVVGGAGTDPNTGAPLILLSLSILWLQPANVSPVHALQKYLNRGHRKADIRNFTTS